MYSGATAWEPEVAFDREMYVCNWENYRVNLYSGIFFSRVAQIFE